jgi:hypothetical protein
LQQLILQLGELRDLAGCGDDATRGGRDSGMPLRPGRLRLRSKEEHENQTYSS